MTRFGSFWIDNVWPMVIGFLSALAYVIEGGGALALLFAPVVTWALWQAGRRAERI